MTGRDDLAGDPDTPDDDLFPEWFDEWTPPTPEEPLPWYRNTRVLTTLIILAFVALLLSTVLLLTLRSPGDFPTGPRITTATTSPAPPNSAPPPTPASRTGTSTTPTTTAPVETAPPDAPPADPPAAEPVAPPPRPARGGSDEDDGPRINVTRSPMSFTPNAVPRP